MRKPSFALACVLAAAITSPMSADAAVTCDGLAPTITATAPGVVTGTAGNDVILINGTVFPTGASSGPVVVYADDGDDTICLPNNIANVVIGGAGTDTVSYEHATQMVVATMNAAAVRLNIDLDDPPTQQEVLGAALAISPAIDLLPTTERLIGGPRADVLIGNVASGDHIRGGPGDDIIVGLFGDDILDGQAGNDLIIGDGIDESTYNPFGGWYVGDVNVPRLFTDNDKLYGGAGNDGLNDDTGDNFFYGGSGNDGFAQGFGDDFIDGGPGVDGVAYVQAAATVDLRVTYRQNTGHGWDSLTRIEDLNGGDYNDRFVGVAGIANTFRGAGGNDFLAGTIGVGDIVSDWIDGGSGFDHCWGSLQFNCEAPWVPDPGPPPADPDSQSPSH